MLEPPCRRAPEPRPQRRVGHVALDQEGEKSESPGPVLPPKRRPLAPVLVERQVSRLVHERVTGPYDTVKHVEITTPGKRGPGVERLVESAELEQDVAPERHVAPRAEDTCAARVEPVIAPRLAMIADLLEAAAEATGRLEEDLSLARQLLRKHQPREGGSVRVLRPCFPEAAQPIAVRDDIVVKKGEQLSTGFRDRAVASEVQAWSALSHVPDACELLDDFLRALGRGGVVHDQDLYARPWARTWGRARTQRGQEMRETTLEQGRTIPGADRDRQRWESGRIGGCQELRADALLEQLRAERAQESAQRVRRNGTGVMQRLHDEADRPARAPHDQSEAGRSFGQHELAERTRDLGLGDYV